MAENQAVETETPDTEELTDQSVESVKQTPAEIKASQDGWCSKDQWRGDPDDWVSAKKFNERGEMMGKIHSLNRRLDERSTEFDTRLANQKKLHEAQMKITIADLESKRDDAIDDANREKANKLQTQIDEVKSQQFEAEPPVVEPKNDQSVLEEWNKNNSWIADPDSPKAGYAIMRFNTHQAKGLDFQSAITAMEADVAKQFPDINPARETASTVESGRSRPGNKGTVKLTWNQLTAEEAKWFNAMPGGTWTKEDYLQSVADERTTHG